MSKLISSMCTGVPENTRSVSGVRSSRISDQTSRNGLPRAVGCLLASTSRYGSFYRSICWLPHTMNIGCVAVSIRFTSVLSGCGQRAGTPRGDADQSKSRMIWPSSPPSRRKFSGWFDTLTSPGRHRVADCCRISKISEHLWLSSVDPTREDKRQCNARGRLTLC